MVYNYVNNAERFTKSKVKITQVGLQPRMVETLATRFPLRVLDMLCFSAGLARYVDSCNHDSGFPLCYLQQFSVAISAAVFLTFFCS